MLPNISNEGVIFKYIAGCVETNGIRCCVIVYYLDGPDSISKPTRLRILAYFMTSGSSLEKYSTKKALALAMV